MSQVSISPGADEFWSNNSGGNFTNSANWNPATVPGVADNANFTNDATYSVTFTSGVTNRNAFFNDGSGTVTFTNSSASAWWTTNTFVVGQLAGRTSVVTWASGTLAVTNAAGSGILTVADLGKGTFNLNGGTVFANNFVSTNTSSSFVFNGGNLDVTHFYFTNSGPAANSLLKGGTLTTRGDSTITGGGTDLQLSGNSGTLFTWNILGGTNLVALTNNKWFVLADGNGQAILNVSGSGTVFTNNNTGANPMVIGSNGGHDSALNVSNSAAAYIFRIQLGNGTTTSTNNSIRVTGSGSLLSIGGNEELGGVGSFNSLTVEAGATNVVNGNLIIGSGSVFSNTVLVTGPGALVSNVGGTYVGLSGYKNSLTISNGATYYAANDGLLVGANVGATNNTVLITGPGSLLQATTKVRVGIDAFGNLNGSNNTLTVLNGGTLETAEIKVNNTDAITNSGGIFQFTTANPIITTSPFGSIIFTNATLSFRGITDANVFADVSGSGNQLSNITYQGNNTFRLNNASNTTAVAQNYTFTTGSGATNFARLELVNGGSAWRSTNLTIGAGGSMLVSNTIAQIVQFSGGALVVTNGGQVFNLVSSANFNANASNFVTLVTGSGSVWSNAQDFAVGYSGTGNRFTIANSGQVVNASSTISSIGETSASSNNSVTVTDAGSIWSNYTLRVGSGGSSNALHVVNGGTVAVSNSMVIGNSFANSNLVEVAGTGSVLRTTLSGQTFTIGTGASSGNQLVVTNGGTVFSTSTDLGGASRNSALVGSGGVWSNTSSLKVGPSTAQNTLTITNGGKVYTSSMNVGYNSDGSVSNAVVASGSGSLLSVSGTLSVGHVGGTNRFTVERGAMVLVGGMDVGEDTGTGGVGPDSSANIVLVTGAGSTLTNSGLFRFGIGGFSHSLTITNGGSVAVGGADGFCLGCGYSSTNSLLITGSGSLLQSTAKFRVGLDYFGAQGAFGGINNNVKVLDGGTLESDHIRVQTGNSITNFGGIYQFTTAAPEIAVTNGSPTGVIVLTNGTVSFRNVASADVFANVGTGGNQLTNITFQGNNTFRLNNSSNATGTVAYNFNTGSGATNYTALELVNGGASWRSERLNIGSNGRMLVSNSLGTVAATFTNQGTTTVAYSRMGWNSNVVTSGRFISDHSTNSFAKDVTVTSTGTLEGQSREWLTFSQSLFINSLNTNQFNLTMATVEFKGSSGGIVHTNAITGSEDGPLGVGYINNFAYGTLRMTNATDTLCLQCGNLPLTNNALYVGFLDLGGNTSLVANVHAPLGINLYYLNSTEDSRNTYLQNKSYQLLSCDGVTAGGMLLPAVPEPSCLLWATLAAGGLLLRRRRPLSADSPVSSK